MLAISMVMTSKINAKAVKIMLMIMMLMLMMMITPNLSHVRRQEVNKVYMPPILKAETKYTPNSSLLDLCADCQSSLSAKNTRRNSGISCLNRHK